LQTIDIFNAYVIGFVNGLLICFRCHSRKEPKSFTFDHSFWSLDAEDASRFSSQENVFEALGQDLLENAFQGYNACIFAYGQTGQHKFFLMLNG
jgi:kinesin family protein 13